MKTAELWQRVKDILFQEWDPIGVNDNNALRDEYDGYAAFIVRLLQSGAGEYKIAKHLRELQRVNMGLSQIDELRNRRISQMLVNLVR